MDIQLLVSAPGNVAGSRTSSADAKAATSAGEFARHLTGASQARQGDTQGAIAPAAQSSSQQAEPSLTPVAAAPSESLDTLAAKISDATGMGETGKGNAGAVVLRAPSLDTEALDPRAQDPTTPRAASWARLSTDDIETALQALKQAEQPPEEGAAASGHGVWDALQERLALIEQAGRPEADGALALLPLAAAVSPAAASTPSAANPAGQAVRTNPLLEAIAAERRAPAGPRQPAAPTPAAEGSGALAAGSAQSTASTDETLRFSAVSDALLAQRGEGSRAPGGSELIGQGAANAMTGAMNGATGGGMAGATAGGAAMAQAGLTAPVASPAWSQQLGQQMVRLSQQGGEQRVELKLHPAELGPLSVSLRMSDHGAQAQFVSAHAQVRQALEQAIPQLREALAEQGISLGETSVGEQRQGGTEGDGTSGRPSEMLASGAGDATNAGTPIDLDERGAREAPLDGRVDLYA